MSLHPDKMTLGELQEERRELAKRVMSEDATCAMAKRFKQLCDAIRYLTETRDWAQKFNAGKMSDASISTEANRLNKKFSESRSAFDFKDQ